MKKLILSSLCMLIGLTSMSAQNALQNEILEVAHRTNNYFMTKYSDPTLDTFVKKVRTSNLWTRAVYYEGLMALTRLTLSSAILTTPINGRITTNGLPVVA